MRNAFAKRFAAVLLALCVLAALPMATAFAAEKTFTVTFYAGEYGVYSEGYVQELKAQYGEANVATRGTDGGYAMVAVKIPAVSGKLPALPDATSVQGGTADIVSSNDAYGVLSGNFVLSGNTVTDYVAGAEVMSNYNLTPEFYLRSDTDLQYSLRFLLAGTNEEVAPAQYGTVPAQTLAGGLRVPAVNDLAEFSLDVQATLNNDSTITYANGYFTLTRDGSATPDEPLEFVFYYTQNVHVTTSTEYVAGDTIVNYNDVTLVGGAGVAGGGAGGAGAGDGAGAGGEEIPDDETPQAGGEEIPDDSTPQAGGEEIPDDSTPQAGGDAAAAGVSMPMVVGGVVVVLAILLIVLLALRKRKGGADGE